ncbi:MAG: calcium/sodium antiporter [Cyclobacteriaceae bacterium]
MEFLDIIMVIGGLLLLVGGGEILVNGATNIAYNFRLSSMVVGLTIVAFGTSAPELLVSLYSSVIADSPNISMGNVIGSNICNLALVLPITALVYPIAVGKESIKIDWVLTIGSSLLLLLFIFGDGELSWYEGIILFSILVLYTFVLIRKSRKESAADPELNKAPDDYDKRVWFSVLLIAGGCIGLFIGSYFFVEGAKSIAESFGVSDLVIGLTVVALGTSMPELITSTIAAYKKDTDMALGNLLGSCIFNVLSILGITSMVKTIKVDNSLFSIPDGDIWWMLGIMVILLPLMIIRKKIGRVESLILLVTYGAYMLYIIDKAQA